MRIENLSKYFKGVGAKRLSAVETSADRSNQHEFNGVSGFKGIFGEAKQELCSNFIYLDTNDKESITAEGFLTWYDAREAHPKRSEYRLYFQATPVSEKSTEGDLLLIGQKPDGSVLTIVAKANSTIEAQLLWLFGLKEVGDNFCTLEYKGTKDITLGFGTRYILEELGVYIEDDDDFLEIMLQKFEGRFPSTRIFSKFSRETISDITSRDDPDGALMAWMNQEEMLFRTLERYIVGEVLKNGFGEDGSNVDRFIRFSLSVQNRRKSRVGHALENHLETIFQEHSLSYSRGKETENKARPDFIFPGIEQYRDESFNEDKLTMLGVKTTCKDRWRQVLAEAKKIPEKHLLTLEPGISENQTDEMKANFLQLVVPKELHSSYKLNQQSYLWEVNNMLTLLVERQKA
jgi:hypothetical protein